jgi:hypothetical protein
MMIAVFVVKGILYGLLALGIAITAVTAALLLSAFIPSAITSAIQSRFTLPHPKT